MAILNFPNTRQNGDPLQSGDQYTGDNGVTYIFDGVKWIGHPVAQPAGTNSITNNGKTVQINADGNLVIPNNATIVYASGAPVVTGGGSATTSTLVNGSYTVSLNNSGSVTVPGFIQHVSTLNYLHLADSNDEISLVSEGNNAVNVKVDTNNNNYVWTFGTDGGLTLPDGSKILGGQWSNNDSGISLLTHDTDFNVYGQVSSSVSGTAYIYSGNNDGTRNLTVKTDSLNNVITVVNNSSTWTFSTDGYLSGQSLYLQGFLKGVDGSTGSTGQVLTRQSNGGVAWADSTGGASTSTRWDAVPAQEGCPIYAELTPDHFQAYTQQSHLAFNNDGTWHLGSNYNSNGLFSNDHTATLYSTLGDVIIRVNDSQSNFTFNQAGELVLPNGGHLGPVGKGWTGLDGGNGQPVSLLSYYNSGMYSGCLTITPGNGAVISTYGDGTGQTGQWTFGNDGNLTIGGTITFPDNSQQTTAYIAGSGGVSINSGTNFALISTTTFTIETGKNSYWIAQFGDLMNNNEQDYGNSVIYDSQGNVIVAVTDFTESASYPQPMIVKYDLAGNVLWKEVVGTVGSAESLDVDSSDNIYLLVNDYDTNTSRVLQLDPTGALINQIDVTGTNVDMYDIVVDGSSNFYVTGYGTNTSTTQLSIFKGNFSGIAWQQGINFTAGLNDNGYSIALDGANPPNIYAFGYSDGVGSELVKLDNNGNVQWAVGLSGPGVEGVAVAVDSAGNSYTVSKYGDDYDCLVAKYDTNGNLVWQLEMANGTNDPTEIQLGDDGYLYIVGITGDGPFNNAIWVAKMDTNGNVQWTNAFSNFFGYNNLNQRSWNGHKDIAVRNGLFAITGATENTANILNTSTYYVPYQAITAQFPTDGTYASPSYTSAQEYQGYVYFNIPWLETTATTSLTLSTATFVTANPGFSTDASTATLVASTLTGNLTTVIHSAIWKFNDSGNIVFPDGTQQSTAYPGPGNPDTGEYVGYTENTGNQPNSVVSIRNATGYKRINNLGSSPQNWFNTTDVAQELGVNPNWITGVSIEFQATSSGIGDYNGYGTMVGTILAAYDYGNGLTSVTHSETAIVNTNGTNDDFVFSALDLWATTGDPIILQAQRTDSNTGQQLDIVWTAKVFINPMIAEHYC